MKNSTGYFKRYCLLCALSFSVYISIAICVFWFFTFYLALGLCVFLYIPFILSVNKIFQMVYIKILTHEQNAQKFYTAIHSPPMRPSIPLRLIAEWYVGNYQELITLSLSGFNTAKSLQKRCICLVFLARAYFELRDTNNLKKTISVFFELKKMNPTKEKVFSKYKIFSFYEAYISGDFDQCIDYTEKTLKITNTTHLKDNLQRYTYQCNLAICYYELGKNRQSKELFENFKKNAPNLKNFYDLSTRYIAAIEHNDPLILVPVVYDINTTKYESQLRSLNQKNKRKRIILCAMVLTHLILLITFEIADYMDKSIPQSNYQNMLIEYENDLNTAISIYYSDAKFIKYFNVRTENQNIDTFCLIDNGVYEGL